MLHYGTSCCDLLENSYLCGISNNDINYKSYLTKLWFAWKFVPLWYQQQHIFRFFVCDNVVICLKIRTFVVSATTKKFFPVITPLLWFAWKFVPLWYQQQLTSEKTTTIISCDLLENSYLCGISNNFEWCEKNVKPVVICLKIRTFVVSATTRVLLPRKAIGCDLLENSYLCGISNNTPIRKVVRSVVVICLKIRTFVVSATTTLLAGLSILALWFAWKFVPLWYQQQREHITILPQFVVICLKIRTFVVSATTHVFRFFIGNKLWFAWKFVPLWYQQQPEPVALVLAPCCDLLENSYLCGISNNT